MLLFGHDVKVPWQVYSASPAPGSTRTPAFFIWRSWTVRRVVTVSARYRAILECPPRAVALLGRLKDFSQRAGQATQPGTAHGQFF